MFWGRPDDGLADRHAEEVLPADGLLVRILEGLLGHHSDRPPAGLDLFQQGMVAQAGRHRVPIDVVPHQSPGVFGPLRFVFFPVGVLGVRLQVQEVGAHRAVTVLEPGQHDPVLHLRHLGADEDRQRIRRGAAPWRIPRPPHAFADRAGFVDMRCTAGTHDHGLRAEHIKVPGTDIETDGPGDPVGLCAVHQQVGHHDPVVDFGRRLAGSLGDDRLVALAVNHDLPLAFALILPGFGVAHHRQAPLLELVHAGIDMPGDVVAQILANQAHEVVAGVADMILGLVLVPPHAHVRVDRIQTLSDGAAALDIGLFGAHDLQIAPPIPGFVRRPAAGHAAADDQDIGLHKYRFSAREQAHQAVPRLTAVKVGNSSTLRVSGSCASS